jgi:hemoglobin
LVSDGELILAEEVTPQETAQWLRQFYDDIGGADFFRRLTSEFYRLVAADETLAPLFRGSWHRHAARLAGHYDRMYGTPDLSEAWEPRLLAAHTGFLISRAHRARWLDLMREAGAAVEAAEPLFSDFIGTMVMATGDMMGVSRGAAIARGERFDRDGERAPERVGDRPGERRQ